MIRLLLPISPLETFVLRKIILNEPERLHLMDPEYIVKLKIAYLELRNSMLIRGGTMSEEDVICENRITAHLGNLARIWAKQAEKFYDDQYPEGNGPPPPPDGGESGPVPK